MCRCRMSPRDLAPIDISLEGIGHILRDRRLDVPAYQRGYAWEETEVSDFWWDLRAAFGSKNSQYFLGTIVLTAESDGRTTIIDGQQRLATTSLLFTALRNEFLRRDDEARARVIESQYIVTEDLRSARQVTRLALNASDQPTLTHAILDRPTSGSDRTVASPTDPNLIRALGFLEERVHTEAQAAGPSWAELLFDWVDFLENRARAIAVSVANEADAFLIFETLNARGRALTVADLLKNYLFGLARDDLDTLQQEWTSALGALEASADEETFTTFVRHLWGSLRGSTRERELYGQIKAEITSTPAALRFGHDLESAAPFYAALLSADHPYWTDKAGLAPAAQTLLRLGLEQNRPLLLAAMRRFDDDEFGVLVGAIISWSVRGLVVGGIGGGTTERAYGEAAVRVSDGSARNTVEVYDALAGVIPTDDEFRRVFASRRINRSRLAKYLLAALSQAEAGTDSPSIVSEATDSQLILRSVMPRTADPFEWPEFAHDDIAQWALRLGNQFVADTESGQLAPLVVLPQDRESWTPEHIDTRQLQLAEMAVALWPRRPNQ